MLETRIKTTGVDHVVLHVSDLARSKRFYLDLLGMSVAHESPGQAFLMCGQQMVALFEVHEGKPVKVGAELNYMALRLESGTYEEVKAHLERHGLKVSGRPGDDRCIYFDDPDDHRLHLLTPGEY